MMRKLVQVTEVSHFIDENKALCDLYNAKGGLYAIKGTILSTARQRVELFVRSADYALYSKFPENGDQTQAQNTIQIEKQDYESIIETFVPHDTVVLYRNIMNNVSSVFGSDLSATGIIDFAEDIISKTFSENKIDLYLCNKAFSGYNKTTAIHSFSVYLLFCEVMFDLRKQERDLPFYAVFKQRGRKVNFSSDQIRRYAMGALLHDIGKIKIPDALLEKQGALTPEEYELMYAHARSGIEILNEAGENSPEIQEMVGNHHQAYPVFPDIEPSPLVEILSMIDIYDACRAERPYKRAFTFKECERILYENKRKYGWNTYLTENVIEGTLRKFETHFQMMSNTVNA